MNTLTKNAAMVERRSLASFMIHFPFVIDPEHIYSGIVVRSHRYIVCVAQYPLPG